MPLLSSPRIHALLEHEILARDVGAGEGEDRLHAGAGVGRAADHVDQLAGAGIDLADPELVGVGVLLGRDDMGDDEIGLSALPWSSTLSTSRPTMVSASAISSARRVGLEMILEPVEGELHR